MCRTQSGSPQFHVNHHSRPTPRSSPRKSSEHRSALSYTTLILKATQQSPQPRGAFPIRHLGSTPECGDHGATAEWSRGPLTLLHVPAERANERWSDFVNIHQSSLADAGIASSVALTCSSVFGMATMKPSGADVGFFQPSPALQNQFQDDQWYRRCFQRKRHSIPFR